MFKNLVQLYSLVVCLIASIVMMITIGIMLGNATDILLPEYKYMNQLDKFTSNEKYMILKSGVTLVIRKVGK